MVDLCFLFQYAYDDKVAGVNNRTAVRIFWQWFLEIDKKLAANEDRCASRLLVTPSNLETARDAKSCPMSPGDVRYIQGDSGEVYRFMVDRKIGKGGTSDVYAYGVAILKNEITGRRY
jgi:hypothetical protein